jgi:transposase
MKNKISSKTEITHKSIKLGVDVHAKSYMVVRQIDGATPQPPQRFTPEKFMDFVQKQLTLAEHIYCCYEAGPFGYGLHRNLTKLGIVNYVVVPCNWDEHHKGVKTDKKDALALCRRLSDYVNGNKTAFSIVRIPTEEEEKLKAQNRLREQVKKTRQRIQAQGRSLLLMSGIQVRGRWWKGKTWYEIEKEAPHWVIDALKHMIDLVLPVEAKEAELTKELEDSVKEQELPYGFGKLTYAQLEREIMDWGRFNNRRQVSSYTGLCPREYSSGSTRIQGSVNKHGNPNVRAALVELSWRLIRWQPSYPPIQKRIEVLGSKKSALKKKAIVAIARQLAVDLWRLFTGQTTRKNLGLLTKADIAALGINL